MKKRALIIGILLGALLFSTVSAQGDLADLTIRLNRDMGYGGFDNKIQGRFSMRVSDSSDFEIIHFYIDDQLIESIDQAPFRVNFHTDSYINGEHLLYAIGMTNAGEEVRSNEFTRIFLSSEEVNDSLLDMALPLIGLVVLILILSTALPRLIWRKKAYVLGNYSSAGGSVCKNCKKPFSRHVWAPNLIAGKLESCPHCGKWQIARRATPDKLEAAEKFARAEDGSAKLTSAESDEERLSKQIEDSRFDE